MMSCRKGKVLLTDLLVDPDHADDRARRHVAECAECARELAELQATMKVLDDWRAPEPDAFFDAKLSARLRREMELAPPGFFSRMRSRLLYNSRRRPRQWAAGALAAMMIVGAGSYLAVSYEETASAPELSATVRDLQSFDSEQQLFEQLNALDAPAGETANDSN